MGAVMQPLVPRPGTLRRRFTLCYFLAAVVWVVLLWILGAQGRANPAAASSSPLLLLTVPLAFFLMVGAPFVIGWWIVAAFQAALRDGRRHADRVLTPVGAVRCPTCNGFGYRTLDGHAAGACATCAGTGSVVFRS